MTVFEYGGSDDFYSFVGCSICGSPVVGVPHMAGSEFSMRYGVLRCLENGHEFEIDDYVPNLLNPLFQRLIALIQHRSGLGLRRAASDRRSRLAARAWLESALGVRLGGPSKRSAPVVRGLLDYTTLLLDLQKEHDLSDQQTRELYAVLASHRMSTGYLEHVANPLVAPPQAVDYEAYEAMLLRRVVLRALSTGDDVVLAELGSGVGRVLHEYASCLSDRVQASVPYRRLARQLYKKETLPGREHLRLVLGVEFEPNMVAFCNDWLRQCNLDDLIQTGRVMQLQESVRDVRLCFGSPPSEQPIKIVCILFQTLGNQIGRDLQVEMLRKAFELAAPRGVVLVSVFNASAFGEQAKSYYTSIRGSVGEPWYWGRHVFLSVKGVYSSWFDQNELETLFAEAGMSGARVFDEGELRVFGQYAEAFDLESQKYCRRRALFGLHTQGVTVDFEDELRCDL